MNYRHIYKTGSFSKNADEAGTSRLQVDEEVLNEIEEHPETSTKKFAGNLNVSHQVIERILQCSKVANIVKVINNLLIYL